MTDYSGTSEPTARIVMAAGTVAAAGHCPPANCVHWGVRRDGDYVNPLQFVQDMRPSVLLPVPQ